MTHHIQEHLSLSLEHWTEGHWAIGMIAPSPFLMNRMEACQERDQVRRQGYEPAACTL